MTRGRQVGESVDLRQILSASWHWSVHVERRLRLPSTFMEEQAGSGPIGLKASSSAAALDTMASKHKLDEPALLPRKRFKASELPLTSTQRSSIDGLLHTIKKKGEYDSLRKRVWSQLEESVS